MKKRVIRWDRIAMLFAFVLSTIAYFNSIRITAVTDTAVVFSENTYLAIIAIVSLGTYLWSIYED